MPEVAYSGKIRIWILTFLLSLYPYASQGKDYEAGVTCGVSRDILDYEDDSGKTVIRGGSILKFSDTFFFNFTALRNMDDKVTGWTWNVGLNNIAGFMNFTAGNYNLHFGSGLMMGKPAYFSPDPFSKKISVSKEKTVSPSNGGNPAYSLYGAVFDFYRNFENSKIYLIPFFSVQRRFITAESYEKGVIESSLFTLNTKIRKRGNNREPVDIINYGGAMGLKAMGLFNFQVYYFQTDLKDNSGRDILWDRGKYYSGEGINLIKNSGIFAEYTDRNISLFIEPAVSSIENENTVRDFALAWGIGAKNRIMKFSLNGRNSGKNFHSEYSSGSRTPERIWETKCAVYPHKFFETGIALYSEKNVSPGYNKDYIEGTMQEEIFAGINTGAAEINLKLKRRGHYSADMDDAADQGTLSAGITVSDRLYIRLKSSVQRYSEKCSYLYGGDIKFLFLKFFSISPGYTGIIINGEMPFYAVITPASEHSAVTCFRESGHGGSVIFRYKKEKDSFYIRYTLIRTGSERKGEAESAMVLFF